MFAHKILLIDDDSAIIDLLSALLQAYQGITVVATTQAAEAIPLVKSEKPDLIVCDIDMDDQDGCVIAQKLKDNPATSSIPLIFLSSLISKADYERSKGMVGGRKVLSKELPSPKVVEAILAELKG